LKKLLHAFNKAAKKSVLTVAAASALVLGTSAPHAHTLSPLQREVITATQNAPAAAPVVKYAYSQERLDSITAKIALMPAGQQLLDFAVRENIRIEMSDSKAMDDDTTDNIFIKGLNFGHLIRLNGDIASDDIIMITLAHEVRHSWHDRAVHSDELQLEPRREWLKRRIQEADCFAYEIHFAYEYEKATGKVLDLGNRRTDDYAKLLAAYEGFRADPALTTGDAYTKLLEKTFIRVHGLEYDKRFNNQLSEIWNRVAANSGIAPAYAARMVNPSTDAEFVREMREVATAGLDFVNDPKALTNWTEADFLSFEKTGGAPFRKDQETFNATQAKYLEARRAWQLLHPANDVAAPAMVAPGENAPPTITTEPKRKIPKRGAGA